MDGNVITKNPQLQGQLSTNQNLSVNLSSKSNLSVGLNRTVYVEKDYNKLINKPQIESVELVGNKALEDIGIDHLSNADLAAILT